MNLAWDVRRETVSPSLPRARSALSGEPAGEPLRIYPPRIFFLLTTLLILTLPGPAQGIGTPWLVKQIGKSDRDGGIKKITVTFKGCAVPPLVIPVPIGANLEPADKAKAVCDYINRDRAISAMLQGTVRGDACKIELKAGDHGCKDIAKIQVEEGPRNHPGDKGTAIKDDPEEAAQLFTAVLDLRGAGGAAQATATLQIGERNPTASVPTARQSAAQIERALTEKFNALYSTLGFRAEIAGDRILIRKVPCPLGIAGGSDDPGLGWLVAMEAAPAAVSGFDLFRTDPRSTRFQFSGDFAIPPGFFAQGSSRFEGTVSFKGVPLGTFQGRRIGNADTVVERRRMPNLRPPFPARGSTPIALAALSLESTQPIRVRVGNRTQLWNLKVQPSPSRPSTGTMTITQRNEQGGVARSELTVYPLFTFTRQGDGARKTLDLGRQEEPRPGENPLTLKADMPWSKTCPPQALSVRGLNDGFCASARPTGVVLTGELGQLAAHGILPALP